LLDCLHWEIILHDVIREPECSGWWLGVELNWDEPTGANVEVDDHLFYLGLGAIVPVILKVNGFSPVVIFSVNGD
jgi:hypothetical protein